MMAGSGHGAVNDAVALLVLAAIGGGIGWFGGRAAAAFAVRWMRRRLAVAVGGAVPGLTVFAIFWGMAAAMLARPPAPGEVDAGATAATAFCIFGFTLAPPALIAGWIGAKQRLREPG